MSSEEQMKPFLAKLLKSAEGTFWEYMDFHLEGLSSEEVEVSLVIQSHHLNTFGIIHQSRQMMTTEGHLFGADGRLCAYGTVTFRVLPE